MFENDSGKVVLSEKNDLWQARRGSTWDGGQRFEIDVSPLQRKDMRKSSLTKVIDNTNFLAFLQNEWIITKLVNSRRGVHASAGGFIHFFCGLDDRNVDSSLAKFQR